MDVETLKAKQVYSLIHSVVEEEGGALITEFTGVKCSQDVNESEKDGLSRHRLNHNCFMFTEEIRQRVVKVAHTGSIRSHLQFA